MIEGFWLVEFFAQEESFGKGVVVAQNGSLLGGDSAFYCQGEYHINNNLLDATLKITRHNEFIPSIFGDINEYELEFKQLDIKKLIDKEQMVGNIVGNEELKITIQLNKCIQKLA